MDFRITGLPARQFAHYAQLRDEELPAHNARRYRVDAPNVFPDRIALRHARAGETVLLVNYTHQPAGSPYRASHASLRAGRRSRDIRCGERGSRSDAAPARSRCVPSMARG